jgi:hypothetical protein
MSDQPVSAEEQARRLAKKRAEDLRGFTMHLGVFLIIMFAFFLLNLATSRETWWFFYPFLVWGVGLAIHGWNVLGSERLFNDEWAERKAQSLLAKEKPAQTRTGAPTPDPRVANANVLKQSAVLIDQMRIAAREIPKSEVRRQALAVCASADQVLSVIEEKPDEVMLARDFLSRYLTPAYAIVSDYARLSSRNIASARPTLEKVEQHDLPLLSSKLDDLHDRLHRGNLIDLEVAREMLRFDVADWDENADAFGKALTQESGRPGN